MLPVSSGWFVAATSLSCGTSDQHCIKLSEMIGAEEVDALYNRATQTTAAPIKKTLTVPLNTVNSWIIICIIYIYIIFKSYIYHTCVKHLITQPHHRTISVMFLNVTKSPTTSGIKIEMSPW